MSFDLNKILSQAQQVQEEFEKIKNEAASQRVVGESGGGMVQVTMTGAQKVIAVKIAPELINPQEITMLQDLIVAAVNRATEESAKLMQGKMSGLSGMMPNIPGLNI